MFSLDVIDTDEFLDMPPSTQNLYFHLGMRADDDGFVSNPKKIMKVINSGNDDLKVLYTKKFIIGFDNGVIVIRHWKMHNYIQADRYRETIYLDEKSQLEMTDNNMYTDCIQNVSSGKVRLELGEDSLGKEREKILHEKNKIPPTLEMVISYCKERNNTINAEYFIDSYNSKGWMIGKNKMKDWQASIRTWEKNNINKTQEPKRLKTIEEILAGK